MGEKLLTLETTSLCPTDPVECIMCGEEFEPWDIEGFISDRGKEPVCISCIWMLWENGPSK